MILICKECGKEFPGTKVTKARQYCDECRIIKQKERTSRYYQIRKSMPKLDKNVPRIATCIVCGAIVPAKPKRKYCPDCKAMRNLSYQRKFAIKDYVRDSTGKLFVKKECKICGDQFLGRYNSQYCDKCRPFRPALRIGTEKKEELKRRLNSLMHAIEDPTNYYAVFGHTLENCAIARDWNLKLFEAEIISDAEFRNNQQRISEARIHSIVVHGKWVIDYLERTKTPHTTRTLVCSLYSDIFGTEFSEFLKND